MAPKNEKYVYLWGDTHNPHEQLTREGLLALCQNPPHHSQWNVKNQVRIIDMRIRGRFLKNAVPPPLYPCIRDGEGLIEMESKPLGRLRVRRMLTGLYNGAEQLREQARGQEETTDINPPFMIVYARHITTNVRLELTSFPDCPGLYYQSLHGLTLFVLDCPAVPSDSSYCHLRLLQAPEVHSKQAFT